MPTKAKIASFAPRNDLVVPRHLAVTMDGNGRWATARGRPRTYGHSEGIKALRRLVELCIRYGVSYVSVFSFSSENWSRPPSEINFIFGLLEKFVETDLARLVENNVRVRVIGDREGLKPSLVELINRVERNTAQNDGLKLQVAFNYGGRADVVQATRALAGQVARGEISPEDIDESMFARQLLTRDVPDPDILLRTSGEHRISNFLLWQSAYSELVFVEELWPDFDEPVFLKVLQEYSRRERRFGGTKAVAL